MPGVLLTHPNAMRLRFEVELACSRKAVFDFHARPTSLGVLLSNQHGFEFLNGPNHVKVGAITHVRARILGCTTEMRFEHTVYDPPRRFAERQVRGIFREFEHLHEFEERGKGSLVRDDVTFELPWWLGGAIAARWVAAPLMRNFFRKRTMRLLELVRDGVIGSGVQS